MLGLHGLLPPHVESLEEQVVRAYEAYQRKDDDLERHIYLRTLQDANEVLFYRLLLDHIEEMTPMVYTPVVALGCNSSATSTGGPAACLSHTRCAILPSLLQSPHSRGRRYCRDRRRTHPGYRRPGRRRLRHPYRQALPVHADRRDSPERTLPIVLDVGTNNAERSRIRNISAGAMSGYRSAYFDFIDQFVRAVKQELPYTLSPMGRFCDSARLAHPQRYRDELLTFNDDIQGTAAVALGAIWVRSK